MTPDTFPSLFWSYTVVWVILGLYIVSLGVRVAKVERSMTREREAHGEGRKASS